MTKPTVVVEFTFTLDTVSLRAEQDVKQAVREFGEALEYLGKVTKSELRKADGSERT